MKSVSTLGLHVGLIEETVYLKNTELTRLQALSKGVKINSSRIFLTGGGGFIGSHLIETLYKKNEIFCFDSAYRGSNFEILLERYRKDLGAAVTYIKGDVRNRAKLAAALRRAKPDYVFHLASIAGVSTVINRQPRQCR